MRNIEPALVTWIDKKLAQHGAAQAAIAAGDARNLMIYAAEACVGIREEGGNNRGPLVKLLQQTIGEASGEAWCMSFVQSMIAYAEVKTGKKSPIHDSEHCMTVWNNTPKSSRVKIFPKAGAIIIWQHGKGPAGHTGFFIEGDGKSMETVEGNTESGLDAGGSVVREGGGVYAAKRSMKANGSMKVIGFLRPF